jgi:hypothetical protein
MYQWLAGNGVIEGFTGKWNSQVTETSLLLLKKPIGAYEK